MTKRLIAVIICVVLCTVCLCGCGSVQGKEINSDLSAVYDDILNNTETPEMVILSEKRMMNNFGIDAAACRQAIVSVCGDSLRTDEIWLVEANSEETANEYLRTAKNRIEQKCAENENYLPEQYAVAKEGKAVQYGAYVAMFVSPESGTMLDIFNAACGK